MSVTDKKGEKNMSDLSKKEILNAIGSVIPELSTTQLIKLEACATTLLLMQETVDSNHEKKEEVYENSQVC